MNSRFVFALLFGFSAIGLGIAIPAFPDDERCGANAEYLECGSACVPDCKNPMMPAFCTMQCVVGCFCRQGFLKNEQGHCVRAQDCDGKHHPRQQIPSAISLPTCPDNEEFLACGSACAPTCANPTPAPICTRNCVVGCFCMEGHLRDANGVCVPAAKCSAAQASMLFAYPPGQTPKPAPVRECGENEEFRQCKGCDSTCERMNPICPRICVPGCACKNGHARSNGKCMPKEMCQKTVAKDLLTAPGPVQKCTGENQVFRLCGTACPATCANPQPGPACTKNCVIGCFCKEGFLKNAQGECVAAANCASAPTVSTTSAPEKCATDRELYVSECGSQLDCMATCHMPPPHLVHGHVVIPPKCAQTQCAPKCVCKHPYVRHEKTGACVERQECDNESPFATRA